MRTKHPEWSERQLACCLYWQGTARKQLAERIKEFLKGQDEHLVVLRCPEATGVNVTATMKTLGIELERPPVIMAYQVALAGSPVNGG